jgi:hypothetical protein
MVQKSVANKLSDITGRTLTEIKIKCQTVYSLWYCWSLFSSPELKAWSPVVRLSVRLFVDFYIFIAITEMHLDNSISNNNLMFSGYHKPLRKDRNRFGGGVALYISNNIYFTARTDLESMHMEILWTEIVVNNKQMFSRGHLKTTHL